MASWIPPGIIEPFFGLAEMPSICVAYLLTVSCQEANVIQSFASQASPCCLAQTVLAAGIYSLFTSPKVRHFGNHEAEENNKERKRLISIFNRWRCTGHEEPGFRN